MGGKGRGPECGGGEARGPVCEGREQVQSVREREGRGPEFDGR